MQHANLPLLLETKLYPGTSAREPLPRPRLDPPTAVTDGICTVACLVAPAGYGKSTLMADWYAKWPYPRRAWLSLDEDDNDPRRLLRYLVGALQTIDPDLGHDTLAQLGGDGFVSPSAALESLAIELARDDRRLVLFIDDLHLLENDDAIRIVDWLVNFAPRPVQFVFGSRVTPPLRLGTLRLRGRVAEFRQQQLAFDHAELERFCRNRRAAALDPRSIALLEEKTEGWPAALEFAVLALEGEPDPQALIDGFAGTDRNVVDYLREVVLDRLDPASRRLLHEFAQFDRICGSLVRAATGSAKAETLLASARARNLFLTALDRRGRWYCFHPLVRDSLRHDVPPGLGVDTRAVLLAGGRWHHARGEREEAIHCAIRAEAWDVASAWVAEAVEDTTQRQGAHELVLRWAQEIPRAWRDRHPVINLNYTFALMFAGRLDEVDAELERMDVLLDAGGSQPRSDRSRSEALRCAVSQQRVIALGLRDDGVAAHAAASAWLRDWPDASLRLTGDVGNVLAWGCKSLDEIDAGLAATDRVRDVLTRDQSHHGLSWNRIIEALLHLKRGDFATARTTCESGLEFVRERLGGNREHTSFLHAILGAIAYEFDEVEAAERAVETVVVHVDFTGVADVLILAYLTQARLQFLRRDAAAGFAALRLGRQLARKRGLRRVDVTLAAEECVWLCRSGDRKDALALAAQFGFDRTVFPEHDVVADKASRVGPRLLLPVAPEMAAAQLVEPLARCASRGLHHRRAELLRLQAAALLRAGRGDEAVMAWREAMELGERYGYRRLFLDDPEIVHALTTFVRGRPEPALAPAWLGDRSAPTPASGRATPSAEALTRKELRILRQLESGLSNREIAASIFVSEGTLKWHLHNIYRKLECRNRTGALAAARKLGLVGA